MAKVPGLKLGPDLSPVNYDYKRDSVILKIK